MICARLKPERNLTVYNRLRIVKLCRQCTDTFPHTADGSRTYTKTNPSSIQHIIVIWIKYTEKYTDIQSFIEEL